MATRSRHAGLASLVIGAVLCLACRRAPTPERPSGEIRLPEGWRFAVASDLQRDTLWDQGSKPQEDNDAARTLIVAGIARLGPGFVAIDGDLVGNGSSAQHWADADDLLGPFRAAKIPVIAAFGNHEYWQGGRPNEALFFSRFPELAGRHWYPVSYGPVAILVLDSNADMLTPTEWQDQKAWFERTLGQLDGDPRVRGVFVLLHHPPYTNSTVTGDELHVQQAFVPAFHRSKKTMAMISGHVHSYERFVRSGKTFIVSGGGGIPRVTLLAGEERRHADDHFAGPPVRGYHFLDFTLGKAGIDVQVMAVAPPEVMDSFSLRWPD